MDIYAYIDTRTQSVCVWHNGTWKKCEHLRKKIQQLHVIANEVESCEKQGQGEKSPHVVKSKRCGKGSEQSQKVATIQTKSLRLDVLHLFSLVRPSISQLVVSLTYHGPTMLDVESISYTEATQLSIEAHVWGLRRWQSVLQSFGLFRLLWVACQTFCLVQNSASLLLGRFLWIWGVANQERGKGTLDSVHPQSPKTFQQEETGRGSA